MKTHWIDDRIDYDGSQLRAHWILRQTGVVGDALVAFRGRCDVTLDEMADLADIDGPGIRGADMVHFLWERFDDDLRAAMLRQRLLACIVAESIASLGAAMPRRHGDDLFVGDGKLTISIATRSLVSTLMHFAINVTTEDVPVAAAGLQDLGVDPLEFAQTVLSRVNREEQSLIDARAKVRAKGESFE